MAATSLGMQGFLARMNVTQLGAPILILMILAMMVLPLPAFVLDVFFTTRKKRWNSRFFQPSCW